MNEPAPASAEDRAARPVFISYATSDRKEALAVCEAIERRGTSCWIACRDVQPGENYQEAIVRAIRQARALVLVFSEAANNSDEIKKELSLASRFRVPLLALRIEDVEPSDAFAYELSTRQWIDAFQGWDKSLDALAARINTIAPPGSEPATVPPRDPSQTRLLRGQGRIRSRARMAIAAGAVALLLAFGAWLLLRPATATAHAMQVRLTGFDRLSEDLPATMPNAVRDEIIAAFADDGVIGVSTAAAPPPGNAPAYAFGGTIRRDGANVRVIARLSNERSGTTLWSHSFSYDAEHIARVPRWIAVDAGNLVRCGLFGASTYRSALPDHVLSAYLQFCHNTGVELEPAKALDFARKVAAAVPDFSWGWSAVEISAVHAMYANSAGKYESLRSEGLDAAAKAIALDPSNSEALAYKNLLIDQRNLHAREKLLQQALKARPLACGCEHHFYGNLLWEVGRTADAVEQFRRSVDVLALNDLTQLALAHALFTVGKPEEAKEHFQAAVDLATSPTLREDMTVFTAPLSGEYATAVALVDRAKGRLPAALVNALAAGFRAVSSSDPAERAKAAALLEALPPAMQSQITVGVLGALGANAQALRVVEAAAGARRYSARAWLFIPSMAGARADPAFPGVAKRLGLIDYWRAAGIKPDFCSAAGAPPVCREI